MTSGNCDLIQNCWVVPDLAKAMRHWIGMGVGPFFWADNDHPEAIYRGRPVPLSFKGAIAQAGSMQIELIEQTSDGPSAYRDSVPRLSTGFHHVLRMTDTLEEDVASLNSRGVSAASQFRSFEGSDVCYMDLRDEIGCMLELLPPVRSLIDLFAMVADAAKGWRGDDPIRHLAL